MRPRRIAQPITHKPLIEELRNTFNPRTVLPGWACEKLIRIIHDADQPTLQLIASADIKFASQAATFEIISRSEEN